MNEREIKQNKLTGWLTRPNASEYKNMDRDWYFNSRKWTFTTAGGAAWRALYVHVNGGKVAYLGIDPTGDRGPQLFGGFGLDSARLMYPHAHFFDFRINIPTIKWMTAYRHQWLMPLYRYQQKFWHGLDGRYGWRGSQTRKAV